MCSPVGAIIIAILLHTPRAIGSQINSKRPGIIAGRPSNPTPTIAA